MKKWVINFLAVLLLLILQTAIFDSFGLGQQSPNLVLLLIVLFAVFSDFWQGLIVSMIGGILLDFSSGLPDGLFLIAVLLTFLTLFMVRGFFTTRSENRASLIGFVALSSVEFFVLTLLINQMFKLFHLSHVFYYRPLLFKQLPLNLVLDVLFIYPVFYYYLLVDRLADSKRII